PGGHPCRRLARQPRAAVAGRAEPVLQLEHDPLRPLLADAGDHGQRAEILGRDGAAQRVGRVHGQHGQGQPGPHAAGRLQQLEDVPLVVGGEAVQGERVLPDHQGGGDGRGGSLTRSSRVTMVVTWVLSARPLPVTAALTSLGVCRATGSPRRAAQAIAIAPACAVPITVRTFCWLNTRSTATASGRHASSQASIWVSIASSRVAMSASADVLMTPTRIMVSARPGAPSTTPTPHLVSPGSTPSTRI